MNFIKTALAALILVAATAAASSPTATVHIKNFMYVPSPLTIKVGDTVTFVNDDEAPHTVTASDKSFDSGNLDQGQSWTHTFTKAGDYTLLCTYHERMKGELIVK